jgi:prepilin-type N-terminal cleavage/methylation domain-containing protein/prepilin-type processing-associated H-X9-DG protein
MAPKTGKSRPASTGESGFTLMELLVVVAVISLIIAILLPVVRKARQISKRAVCSSNLRQLATAWHIYLNDNDGKFYQGGNAHIVYGGWKGTYGLTLPSLPPAPPPDPNTNRPLNKYLGLDVLPQTESEAKIFYCPADDMGTGEPVYGLLGTSYHTNILLIGDYAVAELPSGNLNNAINAELSNLRIDRVAVPSLLLLIGDFPWKSQWLPSPYFFQDSWHGKCCHFNMAFLDGHVDFLKIHKGLHVTDEYRVIPFKNLYKLAYQEQVKEPCPKCD